MGGSGGGSYSNWGSENLSKAVKEDFDKSVAEFEIHLADFLGELLAVFNGRDVDLVRERLSELKEALQDKLETSIDELFGGSVAKHTYIDGFSDIDSLFILKSSQFDAHSPQTILDQMKTILRQHLPQTVKVEHGRMAVTLTYQDGMQIQVLPAMRETANLRVPSSRHSGWSEINPAAFQAALIRRNSECGGKLIPTIKLAKAVIANLPEKYRLSGYHVESLAIAAFENYDATKTTEKMLPFMFEKAKSLVLAPIRDRTGQSVHVDGYLGDEHSSIRQECSHVLSGVAKRMRNASAAKSKAQWMELFGEG